MNMCMFCCRAVSVCGFVIAFGWLVLIKDGFQTVLEVVYHMQFSKFQELKNAQPETLWAARVSNKELGPRYI